jgi:hypothetical protein
MEKMGPTKILVTYFGYRDGQKLRDFAAELKELSTDEKDELVRLAAVELGVAVQQGW